MSHDVEDQIVPGQFLEQLMTQMKHEVSRLGIPFDPVVLTRRERLLMWLTRTSYLTREAIARRILPDAPWDAE